MHSGSNKLNCVNLVEVKTDQYNKIIWVVTVLSCNGVVVGFVLCFWQEKEHQKITHYCNTTKYLAMCPTNKKQCGVLDSDSDGVVHQRIPKRQLFGRSNQPMRGN